MTKDLKRSIREKYKRRLDWLRHAIEQYLIHAEDRLDVSKAGKIRNREETEQIVQKCKNLLSLLPKPKEVVLNIDFEKIFEDASKRTEEIIKQGEKFFESLSPEELAGIINYKEEK